MKYRCPACGFQIFNRRVSHCESCRAHLPADLLFSREEIAQLDAQHEQSRQEREARQRKERDHRPFYDGDNGGTDWSGDSSGGDGGGCD